MGLLLSFLLLSPASAALRDATELRFDKADAFLAKGEHAKARSELAGLALADDDPRRVRRWEREGAVLLREGKVGEARGAFTRALKEVGRLKAAGPDVGRAYAGMGLCLLRQEKKELALRFFRRGLDFDPDEGTKLFLEEKVAELEGGAAPR